MRTDISRSMPTGTLADRAALRARLEETSLSFHALVESLTDQAWQRKSAATAWTVGEVLTHVANGLAHAPTAIEHARRGKAYLNLPTFLNWLTPPINRWQVTRRARGQTREMLLAQYDAAHRAMMTAIEGIRDDEWSRGAHCFGEGYKTILDLCLLPPQHFQEHAAQLFPPQVAHS
jgi:DinB family protein